MPDDSTHADHSSNGASYMDALSPPPAAVPRTETEQKRSDADQSSSERDVAQADADERAVQRDETADGLDRSLHASTDAKFMEAYAAVQADHARSTAEREAAAEDRSRAAEDRARAAVDRLQASEDRDRAAKDREQARIELKKAHLDDLTGFYRPGLGMAILQREIDRSRRGEGRMVLAYCDVDGLKQMNDDEGHAAGDAVLKGLADALRSQLRSYDAVVRVGGDEFVCALSETDVGHAKRAFKDVQKTLADHVEGASVSYGLVDLRPDDDLASLLDRGDQALRDSRADSPPERAIR
jgi:diguanylate cyclase (GGDEF)-like protein